MLIDQNCTLSPESNFVIVANSLQLDLDSSLSGTFEYNPILYELYKENRKDFNSGNGLTTAKITNDFNCVKTYEANFQVMPNNGGAKITPENVKNYYNDEDSITNLTISKTIGGSTVYIRFKISPNNTRKDLRIVCY